MMESNVFIVCFFPCSIRQSRCALVTVVQTCALPINQYLEEYERLSGLSVDAKRLPYYRVLVSYMSVVICGGTGYRVARSGKTHQDVVVAWLAMITHPIAEQMRETLGKVL